MNKNRQVIMYVVRCRDNDLPSFHSLASWHTLWTGEKLLILLQICHWKYIQSCPKVCSSELVCLVPGITLFRTDVPEGRSGRQIRGGNFLKGIKQLFFQDWQPEDRIYPCAILFMVIPTIQQFKTKDKIIRL